jgi:hypothetical protein
MAAPKPSTSVAAARTPAEPPLAALETLFGPPGGARGGTAPSNHVREPDAQNGGRPQRPREGNETPSAEAQSDPSASSVWQALRQADPAQRGAARVTVTVSVTAAERRKLKQMALDQDTTIQKLLEPAVLAVLRSAERR